MARFVLAAFLIVFASALSAERYAFVLGNADYLELSDLENTHADAEAYSQTFAALGFETTLVKDLDRTATLRQFHGFLNQISQGDEVAFVYSGHGWSNGETNFLVPTDVARPTPDFQAILEDSTLPLQNGHDGFLDKLQERGVKLTIAVIDACRNNPFSPRPGRKSIGLTRGLTPVVPSEGTFVIYSAGNSQEALDSLAEDEPEQKLSVFTRNFIQYLKPGIYLQDAILDARSSTIQQAATQDGHRQHPAYYDQTTARICLGGNCEAAAVPAVIDQCKALFDTAQSSQQCYAFEAYLESCGEHVFSPIARSFLKRQCQPAARVEPVTPVEPMVPNDSAMVQACDQSAGHPWHPYFLESGTPPTGVDWADLKAGDAIAKCQRAIDQFPDHARSLAFLARAHDKAGNHAQALKYYQQAEGKGDVLGQLGLGFLYRDGAGVRQNHEQARHYMLQAAERGYAPAQFNLALLYDLGRGVAQDDEYAVKWYQKAARQGYAGAQYNLGVMHEAGRATIQSDTEAFKWYRRAADQGLAKAQFNVGVMYENGRGIRQSNVQAFKWYWQAAEQGYAKAQVNLGWMYQHGHGTLQSTAEAIMWFQKAADQGNATAIENLRQLRQ